MNDAIISPMRRRVSLGKTKTTIHTYNTRVYTYFIIYIILTATLSSTDSVRNNSNIAPKRAQLFRNQSAADGI